MRVFSTPFPAKLVASASVVACEDAPAVEGEAVSTVVGLVIVPECGSSRGMEEARVCYLYQQIATMHPRKLANSMGYGIVSQLKKPCASSDSGLAQREKRHYYRYPIRRRKYITTFMGVQKYKSRFFSPACGHCLKVNVCRKTTQEQLHLK